VSLFNLANNVVAIAEETVGPGESKLKASVVNDPCIDGILSWQGMELDASGYHHHGIFVSLEHSLYEIGGGWDSCDTMDISLRAVVEAGFRQDAHDSNLAASFMTLIDDEERADIAFMVQTTRVHLCKAVLAARSEYFQNLFFGPMKSDESVIHVPNEISLDAFKVMAKWIYTDSIGSIDKIDPAELLCAANYYQLRQMQAQVVKAVEHHFDNDSAIKFVKLADLYNIRLLKTACLQYILRNYDELLDENAFSSLMDHGALLLEIMTGKRMAVPRPHKQARVD